MFVFFLFSSKVRQCLRGIRLLLLNIFVKEEKVGQREIEEEKVERRGFFGTSKGDRGINSQAREDNTRRVRENDNYMFQMILYIAC